MTAFLQMFVVLCLLPTLSLWQLPAVSKLHELGLSSFIDGSANPLTRNSRGSSQYLARLTDILQPGSKSVYLVGVNSTICGGTVAGSETTYLVYCRKMLLMGLNVLGTLSFGNMIKYW